LRIATAREEMHRISEFDYVIVNHEDCLDKTVQSVMGIIRAEHCRVQPRIISL